MAAAESATFASSKFLAKTFVARLRRTCRRTLGIAADVPIGKRI
jgi:hypothetical protein